MFKKKKEKRDLISVIIPIAIHGAAPFCEKVFDHGESKQQQVTRILVRHDISVSWHEDSSNWHGISSSITFRMIGISSHSIGMKCHPVLHPISSNQHSSFPHT